MRDKWFGDKRDLVKWSVLSELAARGRLKSILQVLYYRPDKWGSIEIDGVDLPLNKSVIEHFRRAASICNMECKVPIEVIEDTFADRTEYLETILVRIRQRAHVPGIVFLDPDTGLKPGGKAGFEHVLEEELAKVWQSMVTGDMLVFYQHQTNRRGAPWIEDKRNQFADALGIGVDDAKVAHEHHEHKFAQDVVFFYVEKRRR